LLGRDPPTEEQSDQRDGGEQPTALSLARMYQIAYCLLFPD